MSAETKTCYGYVDVALDGLTNRNAVMPFDSIWRLAADGGLRGRVDCYATTVPAPEEFLHYVAQHKSVSGYDGQFYQPAFTFLDVDAPNGGILQRLGSAVNILKKLGLEQDVDYAFFFSGKKGFHVLFPSGVFYSAALQKPLLTSDELKEFFLRLRRVFDNLFGDLHDRDVYQPLRLIRLPNTLHSETGLYKRRLPATLMPDILSRHIDLATFCKESETEIERGCSITANIPKDYGVRNRRINIDASLPAAPFMGAEGEHGDEIRESQEREKRRGERGGYLCVKKILEAEGVVEGMRNNCATRLVAHLSRSGIPDAVRQAVLFDWNSRLAQPLSEQEIAQVADWKHFRGFSCGDPVLQTFCDTECAFKQTGSLQSAQGFLESIPAYMRVPRMLFGANAIDFATGGLRRGTVAVVIGQTGVGKTALMLDRVLNYARQGFNGVFFSLEMAPVEVVLRLCSNVFNKPQEEITPEEFQTQNVPLERILVVGDDCYSIEAIEKKAASCNPKAHFFVVDYLGLLNVTDDEAVHGMAKLMAFFKRLAKRTNSIVFLIHQLNKSVWSEYDRPSMFQESGSKAVIDLADYVFVCWKNDLITFVCSLDKNRYGRTTTAPALFRVDYARCKFEQI